MRVEYGRGRRWGGMNWGEIWGGNEVANQGQGLGSDRGCRGFEVEVGK